MHLYYCAGINSQSFAGAGGSGHAHCGSGRECNTHVAGAGGNGQKISGSGQERDEENSPAQVSITDNEIQTSLPPVYPSKAWDPSNVSYRRPKTQFKLPIPCISIGQAEPLGQIENT